MSKRLTETEKWKKQWWRELAPSTKLLMIYLFDNCDPAGIWQPDLPLAEFQIGMRLDREEIDTKLAKKVKVLPDGKWFIEGFVKFQKGVEIKELNPSNKAHLGVLRCLEKYKKTDFADAEQGQLFEDCNKPHQSPIKAPTKPHQRGTGVGVKVYIDILNKYNLYSIYSIWMEWVEYRKEIRHRLTKSMAEKQIKFLAKFGEKDAKKIIEESIKNGWTGLFELDGRRAGKKDNNIADKLKGG